MGVTPLEQVGKYMRIEFELMYFRLLPKKWKSVLIANYIEHSADWLGFRLNWVEFVDTSNVQKIRSK